MMKKQMDRRDFLRVAGGAAVGSTLLAGCGGSGSGGAGTLEVWSTFDSTEQQRFYETKVIKAFNATQSGAAAKLTVKQTETIDQLLQTALAAGSGPGIVPTPGPSYVANYVNAGQFLALDEFAEQYGWKDQLLPWAVATGTIDGTLYSLPAQYESMILVVNPAVFEANGWSVPTDLAAFEAICDDAAAKGMMPIAAGNAEYQGANEWHVTNVFNAAAGPGPLFQALNGDLAWTDPVFVDAIALLAGWSENEWLGGGRQAYFTNDFGPQYEGLASGTAAMMMTGSWALVEANDYFGEAAGNDASWDWAPLPALSGDVEPGVFPLGVGATLSINAKAAEPEVAGAFLDYILDAELQGQGLAEVGLQPFPVKLESGDFPAEMDDRVKRFYTDLGSSENVGYTTWTFWPPKSNTYIVREMDKVILGDVSPEEFCAGLDEVFAGELESGAAVPVSAFGEI